MIGLVAHFATLRKRMSLMLAAFQRQFSRIFYRRPHGGDGQNQPLPAKKPLLGEETLRAAP